jgi:Mrp family chromosome partitioning ATPase
MGRVAQMPDGKGVDRGLDVESFRILRRNLEFLDWEHPPRSILVTSGLPEEGKTTVASSLAFAMASAGRQTLLVDCDLRRPALAERLRVKQSPGLSEYLAGAASPQDILRTVAVDDPAADQAASSNGSANGRSTPVTGHKLVLIPSGATASRGAELLGSERFKEFLKQVSSTYEVIVLDSSPLLPIADTLEIVPEVDAVILCARESKTTREQAHAAKAALARFPERPTGLVVTGVTPSDGDEVYSYSYDYS